MAVDMRGKGSGKLITKKQPTKCPTHYIGREGGHQLSPKHYIGREGGHQLNVTESLIGQYPNRLSADLRVSNLLVLTI